MKINSKAIKEIFDGSLLTKKGFVKQIPYICFLTILAIIYIGNRFNAENTARKIVSTQKEIKDLRTESVTVGSELMRISNLSEIQKLIEKNDIDLKAPNVPPKKIIINEE